MNNLAENINLLEDRAVDPVAILAAVQTPVFVIDEADRFLFVNPQAEQFFHGSAATLIGRPLVDWIAYDSPALNLIEQVRRDGNTLSEYGIELQGPRFGSHLVTLDASLLPDREGYVVVVLQERAIARKIDKQLNHRSAARSVSAMASMLGHEVKNPLSGIRGAAQLLELNASAEDRELTRLICDETDRIATLVESMEMFADAPPNDRVAVNIHEVLHHVCTLARSGFAKSIEIVESYDPSLPATYGNRDLLVQAVLNLVKNAAEAAPKRNGEIRISTRFQQGVRFAPLGRRDRVSLPLMVTVQDNGPGVPEDLQQHLFDPFVTTKPKGKGLGLALVAKIVGDHGGIVELDSQPGQTQFHLLLPMAQPEKGGA